MLVLLMIVAAAGLLVHGVIADRGVEVFAAGGLSIAALVAVLGVRWWETRQARADGVSERIEDEGAPTTLSSEPPAAVKVPTRRKAVDVTSVGSDATRVVFVAGRTTFHAPSCSSVEGRAVSQAERSALEGGGMTACRRCLPAA